MQFDGKPRSPFLASVHPSPQSGLQIALDRGASTVTPVESEVDVLMSQAARAEDSRQSIAPETFDAARSFVQQSPQGRWPNASRELEGQPDDSPSIMGADTLENEERSAADTPPRIPERPDSSSGVQNGATTATVTGTFNPDWAAGDPSILTEQEFEAALELDLSEVFSERGREGVGPTTFRQSDMFSVTLRTASKSLAETIGDRVQTTSRESFDVRLSPEELGNLRISFRNADSGLNVSIHADRPETLELFRRNIEMLS
ncbi:flagellar hook-length control protein FliK [Aliiruegeria lutimaris]|uniref:Hook-length control protein FliK n=1 Tax=Aliiruegeria lutimaris TaxID=571298 RepID=A0A1G9JQ37_9RHOB|nr:flagellar hook-length control protein FliK [Aliiruegeria lutimaris]SDL39561.1 hook-length control protein FliK [Aliiruegeria lutimaris]